VNPTISASAVPEKAHRCSLRHDYGRTAWIGGQGIAPGRPRAPTSLLYGKLPVTPVWAPGKAARVRSVLCRPRGPCGSAVLALKNPAVSVEEPHPELCHLRAQNAIGFVCFRGTGMHTVVFSCVAIGNLSDRHYSLSRTMPQSCSVHSDVISFGPMPAMHMQGSASSPLAL
jgi:hypothetical protein